MSPALASTATLLALLAVCFATGRVVVAALALRRLRRLSPESAAVSSVLGLAAWTTGFALATGPGRLPARPATLATAVVLAALGVMAFARRRRVASRARGSAVSWLVLCGTVVLTGSLALLPVWAEDGYLPSNDTYTYCALADWLQLHAFGGPAAQPDSAFSRLAVERQQLQFPLGASYPLAMVQASGAFPTSVVIFPAVSALGLVLSLLGVWCASRMVLQVPPAVAAAVVLAFALVPHAGYWAHHHGFLSQTLAVPALLVGVSTLASGRGLPGRSGVVVFAVLEAFLYFVYLPFAGLLALAAAVSVLDQLARAGEHGRRRVLGRAAAAAAAVTLLIGLQLPMAARFLVNLAGASVGAHVPLTAGGFAAIALGTGPGAAVGLPRGVPPGGATAAFCAAVLAAVGIARLGRLPRGRGLIAVSLALLATAVWSALGRDPWTGDRGHTWSLFKTVQWGFPVVLLMQAAGLACIGRRVRRIELVYAAGALALFPPQLPWALQLGRGFTGIVDGPRPLSTIPQLAAGLRALPEPLLLVGQPSLRSVFRGGFFSLFAGPRPVPGDWELGELPFDHVSGQMPPALLDGVGTTAVSVVLAAAPPFDTADRRDLGGGFAVLEDVGRPRLVQVAAPPPWSEPAAGRAFVIAPPRSKLLLLAPDEGPIEVAIDLALPASIETSRLEWQVVPGSLSGARFRRLAREAPLRPLELARGRAAVIEIEGLRGLLTICLVPGSGPLPVSRILVRRSPGAGPRVELAERGRR